MTKTVVEVSVGQLPDWYLADEGNNDVLLKSILEDTFKQFYDDEDVEVHVSYNYQRKNAIVKSYDSEGKVIVSEIYDFHKVLNHLKKELE